MQKARARGMKKSLSKTKGPVLIGAGLVLLGCWVNIVGYSSAFLSPALIDVNYTITRYAYHFGRIAVALLSLAFPLFFERKKLSLNHSMPLLMCLGTVVFALSFHQTLFLPVAVGSIGSFMMGFCYMWFVAAFYLVLAQGADMRKAIVVITVSQVFEQVISVVLNYAIPESAQIALCFAFPLAAFALLVAATKEARPLPEGDKLSGRAENHLLVLLVASNIALVAIGAVSNIGIWGNVRIDFLLLQPVSGTIETIAACAIVAVLAFTTLVPAIREQLSFRYQVPFLVIIAGFILAIIQLIEPGFSSSITSVCIMAVEFYAHVFFWTIFTSAYQNLSMPPYRIVGIGFTSYSVFSVAWMILLESNIAIAGTAILVILYCLIIVIAIHPRILYKKALPETTVLEEMNEYTIEGEPEIPREANGMTVEETLKNRCDLLSERYKLSAREEDVLLLLAQGRTRTIIQARLVMSEGTAKTHITHIYEKMGVRSHQELIDLVYLDQVMQQA